MLITLFLGTLSPKREDKGYFVFLDKNLPSRITKLKRTIMAFSALQAFKTLNKIQ